MPKKENTPWMNMLDDEGPEAVNDALTCAVEADTFLKAAVRSAGIDWCLSRLREVKKQRGHVPNILDAILPSASPEGEARPQPKSTDSHKP